MRTCACVCKSKSRVCGVCVRATKQREGVDQTHLPQEQGRRELKEEQLPVRRALRGGVEHVECSRHVLVSPSTFAHAHTRAHSHHGDLHMGLAQAKAKHMLY